MSLPISKLFLQGSDPRQRGYNLVEVMIAMAILGSVLLSIITLFFLGQRNVYSGKQMTKASSVETRVLEDLNTMTDDDILTNFVITDATALTAGPVVVGSTSCTNCLKRDTNTISAATDAGGYLASWKTLLSQNAFANGKVSLLLTPTDPPVAGVKKWTTAQFLRITIVTEWDEGSLHRNIVFQTAKAVRP
ncbi:MAG TPA: prepilin-type N-terminal cleavage/methylation domain-containing protein [Thermoanaerobaculia bacterium]|nr:prepilin-type N-terminal cleavage/methylation domain-containing protein [Thermoanaerobaculia bacterium]